MSTERMGNRCDDADLALSVVKGVAARGFSGRVGKLAYRTELIEFFQDLVHGDDHMWRPNAVFFERHEFNKAHDYAFFAGEAGEFDDLIFIEAAQQDRIDLHGLESRAFGRANPGQHPFISVE